MLSRIVYSGVWLIVLAGIGYLGYYGYSKLSHDFVYESGAVVATNAPNTDTVNIEFEAEDISVEAEAAAVAAAAATIETPAEVAETTTTSSTAPAGDHSDLLRRLGNLVDDVIQMRVGSSGTRVGTVQEFLNLYNGTSTIVDKRLWARNKGRRCGFPRSPGARPRRTCWSKYVQGHDQMARKLIYNITPEMPGVLLCSII